MSVSPPSRPRRTTAIVGGLALAAVLIVFAPQAGILRDALPLLKRARPQWLIIAALCQGVVYACVAAILRVGLQASFKGEKDSEPPSFGALMRAGGAFIWANRALPGPALAGLATLIFLLGRDKRRPVPAPAAQAAAATFYLSDYAGFITLAILCGMGLWLAGRKEGAVPESLPVAPAGIALAIILVGAGSAVALLRAPQTARRVIVRFARFLATVARRPKPAALAETAGAFVDSFYERWREISSRPGVLAAACGWAFVMHVFESATLTAVVLSFRNVEGVWPAAHLASSAAASYTAGNLAAIISFLPAGLGFFEGTMGVTLHLLGRIPVVDAAAATVVYRILSVWLPLPLVLGTARQAMAAVSGALTGKTATAEPAKEREGSYFEC